MKTGYKVMDAMTTKPISIDSDLSLQECANLMDDKHIGAVIVRESEKPIGILTEQDIVRKVVAKGINPLQKSVKEFMEPELATIEPDADIYSALIKMRDMNIRHLPVLKDDALLGLLTIKDILKIQPQLFDLLVEKFELREEKRKPINRILKNEGLCNACGEYCEEVTDVKGTMLCSGCSKDQI